MNKQNYFTQSRKDAKGQGLRVAPSEPELFIFGHWQIENVALWAKNNLFAPLRLCVNQKIQTVQP